MRCSCSCSKCAVLSLGARERSRMPQCCRWTSGRSFEINNVQNRLESCWNFQQSVCGVECIGMASAQWPLLPVFRIVVRHSNTSNVSIWLSLSLWLDTSCSISPSCLSYMNLQFVRPRPLLRHIQTHA